MKRLVAAFVLAALVYAAPAAANTASAGGTVLANGTSGSKATFKLDFESPATRVVYVDRKAHIRFTSTDVSSAVILPYVVKLSGTGVANGRTVHFVAIATDHPTLTGDWFKISWNHGPSYGGRVLTGGVTIDALIAAYS